MRLFDLTIFCLTLLLLQDCSAYFYPPVIWQKDNCAFRQLQESKASNAAKEFYIQVVPNSGMNVVCPNYVTVNSWLKVGGLSVSNPTLLENMWLVDKQGYDKCVVNEKGDPNFNKLFLLCNKPKEIKYKSLIFHEHFNQEEPKFAPGRHYYFISTSRGFRNELSSRKVSGSYGSCERYHMKLHIYVCDPKKEDCVWEMPRCDPPAELKREMVLIDGKLPAPTQQPEVEKPKTQSTKTMKPTTNSPKEPSRSSRNKVIAEEKPNKNNDPKPICPKKEKSVSIHLILNFVLGGVALFMAIVIIILVCGITNKTVETTKYQVERPESRSSSAYEPNKYIYVETLPRHSDMHRHSGYRQSMATIQSGTLPLHLRQSYSRGTPSHYTPPTHDGGVFVFPEVSARERRETRVEAILSTRSSDEVSVHSV